MTSVKPQTLLPHGKLKPTMGFTWSAVIGFFLGFAFGVGCALAVMYSIFMGGYRAAIKDSRLPEPPERYLAAMRKASATP